MNRSNWIAVASAQHARLGRDNSGMGFMQVGHGKRIPLKRVSGGDRVAYYAPVSLLGGADKLQSFVSIGIVQPGDPYEFDMGNGFIPWRRDVRYAAAQEVRILPLLDKLEFIEDPKWWGYKFRFGMFQVSDHDIHLIDSAMNARARALDL